MSLVTGGILFPRQSGEYITSRCKDVSINNESIARTAQVIAESFITASFSIKSWKEHALHPKVADENSMNTIFVIDVLNFCFWPDVPGEKFKVHYGGKAYTGYWSLVAALKRASDKGIPVYDAKFMANVTEQELQTILNSDSEIQVPMFKERLQAYRECGNILHTEYQGMFANCVKNCNKDAMKLLNLIVEKFPCFRDESVFNDQRVSFYKRAQILIADIWCCFEGKGLGEFTNIHEITMFADYRVPQSLEYFGILEYSEKLKKVLSERTVLPSGHRYELEIRGTSIESIERLTAVVKKILRAKDFSEIDLANVNAITVDNFLWDYARDHREQMSHLEFHLVRTIFY